MVANLVSIAAVAERPHIYAGSVGKENTIEVLWMNVCQIILQGYSASRRGSGWHHLPTYPESPCLCFN